MHLCDILFTVQLLVELGVSINQGDSVGLTPLHLACTHGYPNLVGLLLKARANVNARSHQNRTPLHLAAMRGNQGKNYSALIIQQNIMLEYSSYIVFFFCTCILKPSLPICVMSFTEICVVC